MASIQFVLVVLPSCSPLASALPPVLWVLLGCSSDVSLCSVCKSVSVLVLTSIQRYWALYQRSPVRVTAETKLILHAIVSSMGVCL